MLPPPAPTLEISTESALMIRSCSSSNVLLTNGRPSTISETSVDVPPTSAQRRLPSPIASPSRALEIVPAAGPAKTIRNGCSSASAQGSSVAAQSAKLRSPVKPSSRSCVSSSCEYSVKMPFMNTSTTVVDARAYSLASGDVSDEIETGMSPSTSRTSSRRRSSCSGLTYELSRQIATPSTSQRSRTASCSLA